MRQLDQASLQEGAKAASSVPLLTSAAKQGIPIYHITSANSSVISGLGTTADIRDEIS